MGLLKWFILTVFVAVVLYGASIYFSGCIYLGGDRIDGKTVIITGANTGIGLETAKGVARRGGRVIMACRSMERCEKALLQAVDDLAHVEGSKDKVDANLVKKFKSQLRAMKLDLSSGQSIRQFVTEYLASESHLDILVNNAGVMALPQWTPTTDGFEMQFGVNHMGHFLLTHLLLPRLIASKQSRIIAVSSLSHMWANDLNLTAMRAGPGVAETYAIFGAYSASKLANVIHAAELDRRYRSQGVLAVSAHPGAVKTELSRYWLPEWVNVILQNALSIFFKSAEQGAQTSLTCILDPSVEKHPGAYYAECAPKARNSLAEDKELATKLWDYSMKQWNL